MNAEACLIERAVKATIEQGIVTVDLAQGKANVVKAAVFADEMNVFIDKN